MASGASSRARFDAEPSLTFEMLEHGERWPQHVVLRAEAKQLVAKLECLVRAAVVGPLGSKIPPLYLLLMVCLLFDDMVFV